MFQVRTACGHGWVNLRCGRLSYRTATGRERDKDSRLSLRTGQNKPR